jgi:hypothetical protein
MITIHGSLYGHNWLDTLTNWMHFLDQAGESAHIRVATYNSKIVEWAIKNNLSQISVYNPLNAEAVFNDPNQIAISLHDNELVVSDQLQKWLMLGDYLLRHQGICGFHIPVLNIYKDIAHTILTNDIKFQRKLKAIYKQGIGIWEYTGELIPCNIENPKDYLEYLKTLPIIVDVTSVNTKVEGDLYSHNLVRYIGNVLVSA